MDSSGAQRLLSRTRTLLPTTQALLQPQPPDVSQQRQQLKKRQQRQARYFNRTKDLPTLGDGDVVRVEPLTKDGRSWRKATVIGKSGPRSYRVQTADGGRYRRNRRHLRKTGEEPDGPEVEPDNGQSQGSPDEIPETESTDDAHPRPTRVRRPPAYLQDYVCT